MHKNDIKRRLELFSISVGDTRPKELKTIPEPVETDSLQAETLSLADVFRISGSKSGRQELKQLKKANKEGAKTIKVLRKDLRRHTRACAYASVLISKHGEEATSADVCQSIFGGPRIMYQKFFPDGRFTSDGRSKTGIYMEFDLADYFWCDSWLPLKSVKEILQNQESAIRARLTDIQKLYEERLFRGEVITLAMEYAEKGYGSGGYSATGKKSKHGIHTPFKEQIVAKYESLSENLTQRKRHEIVAEWYQREINPGVSLSESTIRSLRKVK
jgi:hypothetical protein